MNGDNASTAQTAPGSFFRWRDWSAFWTAFAISFAVYFYTLAPSVTLEDCGELATASAHLGVPHPPGYPIWSIMTWFFTKAFAFVTIYGQPNPAWSVGLASAVFGALATGFTSILICRSGIDMLRGMKRTTEVIGSRTEDVICWAAGVSASLIFAFTPVNWSQSVIVEVYSLNTFFLVLIMFLCYVWLRSPREPLIWVTSLVSALGVVCYVVMVALTIRHLRVFPNDISSVGIHYVMGMLLGAVLIAAVVYAWKKHPDNRLLYLTALVFGLGLTNYQVLLLLLVSLALVVLLKDLRLFRDFMIIGLPFVLGYVFTQKAVIPSALAQQVMGVKYGRYPFCAGLAIASALIIGAMCIFMPSRKGERFPLYKQFLLTIMPYFCLFLLLAGQVLDEPPADSRLNTILPHLVPATATSYVYILLALALMALAYCYLPSGAAVAPAVLCMLLGLAVYVYMPLSSETNPPINWGYPRTWEGFLHALFRGQYEKIVPTPILSMQFVRQIGDYLRDLRGTFTLPIAIVGFLSFAAWNILVEGRRIRALYIAVGAGVAAVVLIMIEEAIAPKLGQIAALSVPYRALAAAIILLAVAGGIIMAIMEVIDLFCRLLGIRRAEPGQTDEPPAIGMDIDNTSQKWTLVILSGFAVMSFVLVSLASPKGDIQDEFIQRVKFISSHALFTFWIGYGLVLGLACVDTLLRGNRLITWGGIAAVLLLPAIPLLENGYNKELLRISGGAEQNGHDFGWQFGNYQLRGAQAVSEELSPAEEPIPNPTFPREMGPEAVFFGGTDPGRFVPTYMIYDAMVRPDVYLITQNALADNTYMQVMRDLYGDRIWIPSQEDSARAFQRYVEEVKSGKRPPSAELKIEGGRVQVSGALGVMEINGILAQMIFEHNNWKHEFFVEESYVIQWMYPYLEPHGLIMKIDPAPNVITDEMVRNDQDFWDWYTRRLAGERKFVRDIVARKSFSKLRSAIAGLYARRGKHAEAENAFQQARILYSLSPEANFRLVQEVLMNQGRFREAREVMGEFGSQDPGNDRVPDFLKHLERLEKLLERTGAMEEQRRKGKMDVNTALELSECYVQLQRFADFRGMMEGLLSTTNLPPAFFYRAATLARDAKDLPVMLRALERCASDVPGNSPPEIYLNLARMYIEGNRADRAVVMMQDYVKRTPADWKAWLDLAYLYLATGQTNNAVQGLLQARNYGSSEAMAIIEQDPRFAPVRGRLMVAPRNLMGMPGIVPPERPRLPPQM